MTPLQRKNLARLFAPKHIAFIGGTDAEIAMGEARRIGYAGEYWPVNPNRETIAGTRCFASVEDLPQAPDAVFLAIPSGPAVETVAKLGAMGSGGVICYTAGFAEAGTEGQAAEQALVKSTGEMALIGPNCYGMINYLDRVALWPFAHGGSTPGYGCAIITQSGMLSSDLTMSQRSLPLTHMISIGNQAVLSMEDLVDVLCEDDRVRAIGLHIEGIKDVAKFANAAIKATSIGKPIVALKTGSSAIGKSLASSHTGSLSGEDDLYNALFERTGIIRVYSPSQLLETLKFVSVAGVPAGNRVAGFTCSGGGATMLADHAEKIGLEFPAYTRESTQKLSALLPAIATVSNPLDYTTPIWGQTELTRPVFKASLEQGFNAAVLVQDYPAKGLDESRHFYQADAQAFADATGEVELPAAICSTLPENLDLDTRELLVARGIAPMQGINETLEAMTAATRWGLIRKRVLKTPPASLLAATTGSRRRTLHEGEAKKRLGLAGIAVPQGESGQTGQLTTIARQLGFPLVLKMLHAELLHKTEAGAVCLNLVSEEEVVQAAAQMIEDVLGRQPAAVSKQFLLEKMQPEPIAELIVSIRCDAQFGYVMTLGSGGLLVELVQDSVTLLLPAAGQEYLSALEGLKVFRLLQGFRGKPKADLDVLVDHLDAIALFMLNQSNRLCALEINPLFVYDDRVCAVDALVSVQVSN